MTTKTTATRKPDLIDVLCNGAMNALANLITVRPDFKAMDIDRLCAILRKVMKAEIPKFLETEAKDLVDCQNEYLVRASVSASCGLWASMALKEYEQA